MIKRRFLSLFILVAVILPILVSCRSAEPAELPTEKPEPVPSATVDEISAPVTVERQVTNLVAFARLYGVVRYFHPSDQVFSLNNWGRFTSDGVEAVRGAGTADELAERLEEVFQPLAPTAQVISAAADLDLPAVNPDSDRWVMWEHYGVAADSDYDLYTSERTIITDGNQPEPFYDLQRPYTQPLTDGLVGYVPLALPVVNGKTAPDTPLNSILNVPAVNQEQDGYLAGAITFWAVTQHFYPYFDLIEADWDAALARTLEEILTTETEAEWELALQKLIVDLEDGHGYLNPPTRRFLFSPNVVLGWVEEQVVVLEANEEAADQLQLGDIVLTVGGQDVMDLLQAEMALQSSPTEQFKRMVAVGRLLGGPREEMVEMTVLQADGREADVSLERTLTLFAYRTPSRPDNFTEVAPSVFYIDLFTEQEAGFEGRLMELEQVRGLIFDLRGYPLVEPGFISLLIDETVSTAQFLVPQNDLPNQEKTIFDDGSWTLEPAAEAPVTQNVVFLTDGRAISYSETLLAMVAHHEIGEIVGEPTAGTNGDINTILLPSGHTVVWTGLLVKNQDGSQHHGVGVQPTVPASLTLADVRNGIDTQLQAAIQLIEDSQ